MDRILFYLTLNFVILIFLNTLDEVEANIPGTFFWKPRMGVYLTRKNGAALRNMPKTRAELLEGIRNGTKVVIREYGIGVTVLALATGVEAYDKGFIYLQPDKPYFYTNAYRWGLRHLDLVWYVIGNTSPYSISHRVWKNRFTHMDSQLPKALRWLVPFIPKTEWDREQYIHKMYKKEAENTFAKHYRYPEKQFDNWKSEETVSTKYISSAVSD